MSRRTFSTDEIAVSEVAGIGILLFFTVVITASVGLGVLFVDESAGGAPRANFTFDYIQSASVLLITHDRGDAIAAGNITVRGPNDHNATWAQLANANDTALVTPGDTVQIGNQNAYGDSVGPGDRIRVYYAPPTGNETELSTWKGV
ncbi:MAG: type IV pilin N-terminal domain-containing protein [Haloarculaceae archaeon]